MVSAELPYTEIFRYHDAEPGQAMQFRLFYKGRLPAESSDNPRPKEKHAIRRALHPQLETLWRDDPHLRLQQSWSPTGKPVDESSLSKLANRYRRCGHRFIPLIAKATGASISLDITFLRRDQPGNLIRTGGDIDNRLKVVFDALRIPDGCNGIPDAPGEHEDPFYCLLEDDSLVTEVSVTTDRLLVPPAEDEKIHDVVLIIHVIARLREYASLLLGYED